MISDPDSIAAKAKRSLVDDLRREGFDGVAVASPDTATHLPERLASFVAKGHHATMDWIPETQERRGDPRILWPEVRSIIMVAMNYGPHPDSDPLDLIKVPDRATISVYAQNRDYHDIIKGKLKQAAGRFAAKTGSAVKVFVDTAPVMEKPLAEMGGLGWQGKHTNLVSRELGSWFFLGSIFTDMDLPPDEPETDHCGSCRACLDICPTDAFPVPHQLDARRCISYLTIEHADPIPHEFRKPMGNRIYGCDDCLAICPWNKFASEASEAKLMARDDLKHPAIADLLPLDDASFRQLFSGSPIKRIGRNRFIRNVLIAAGNSGEPKLATAVEMHLKDDDPVVRGAAVWALGQLCNGEALQLLHEHHSSGETDAGVLREWEFFVGAADTSVGDET